MELRGAVSYESQSQWSARAPIPTTVLYTVCSSTSEDQLPLLDDSSDAGMKITSTQSQNLTRLNKFPAQDC